MDRSHQLALTHLRHTLLLLWPTCNTLSSILQSLVRRFSNLHWGRGGLKPVITCWEHWELWLNEPSNFMVITYRTHLKCIHKMCSIWDWWEHFCGMWIVTSTCASYVTTHNSWQSFEICPTIFSKCSYDMPSGNILITWLILRNIWNLFKILLNFWHVIVMFLKTSHVIKMFPLGIS